MESLSIMDKVNGELRLKYFQIKKGEFVLMSKKGLLILIDCKGLY